MNIITEYPIWFLIFCVAAGAGYSFLLYKKDKKLSEVSKNIVRLMAFFRFVVVTVLSFFLLSPLLKSIEREVEKPLIVIAHDNSESILINKDSSFIKGDYIKQLNELVEELSEKYEVKQYAFGDNIKFISSADSLTYNDKQTDISSFFLEADNLYSNRNIGAVILATDGIYNKGFNPIYSTKSFNIPIYTVALGDTTIRKDLILSEVRHNRIAYLGNQFPLEIIISAKQLRGKTSVLTVSKDNDVLFSQPVNINSDAFSQTIPVLLEAKKTGLQHYKIKLDGVEGEITYLNNSKDIYIEVLDTREKILILCDAPHPDVAALKEAIQINQNYEAESYTLDNFNQPFQKYNLIILHNVSNSTKNRVGKLLNDIYSSSTSVWIISGANNYYKNDISNPFMSQQVNESEPIIDNNFSLFTMSDELLKGIKKYPAISTPFVPNQNTNKSNVLLYQRIGVVDTKIPLMYFDAFNDKKIAVFTGEGLWKWRLYDYAANSNHNVFNEFVSKTVQYLSVKENKSFFKVTANNTFKENESIDFFAEVYNQSYELINEPEVSMVITNKDNKNYSFTFSKTSNAYKLNAGIFPVGEYVYSAKVNVGGKVFSQNGRFTIIPLQIEHTTITADHKLLYNLSAKTNAEMIYPQNVLSLAQKLINREDIKSVSYSQKKFNDLINLKWVFFLLLALLSFEWFIRKRNGTY